MKPAAHRTALCSTVFRLSALALAVVLLWQKRWGNGRLFPLTLLLANLRAEVHLPTVLLLYLGLGMRPVLVIDVWRRPGT